MTNEDETRLVRIEEIVAHQNAAIEDLSRQLGEHWLLIERLRGEIRMLTEQLESADDGADTPAASQKPPHW